MADYTQSILIGVPKAILQNVEYALPARTCLVQSVAATEFAIAKGGTYVAQATSATTGFLASGGFVKCTSGNTTILCKAA